jgi:uncharacterized protein
MKGFARALTLLASLAVLGCSEPAAPTVNLNRAVQLGDIDQIRRHIYWKTDVNQPNAEGDTPLHVAAGDGRVTIARELVRNGADPRTVNASGQTPLYVALARGRTQVAMMLVDHGVPIEPQSMLIELVGDNAIDRDALGFLINAGAKMDEIDTTGNAPLHVAIRNGHLNATRRLILAGADVNQPDGDGRLPLRIARESATGPDARFIVSTLERNGARADPAP